MGMGGWSMKPMGFFDGEILGKREVQEDSRVNERLESGFRLHVLADGMGGEKGGQIASQTTCGAFQAFFETRPVSTNPEEDLWEALDVANGALAKVVRGQPELEGMGTTLIALLLNEKTHAFSFISVGDSPLYRLSSSGLKRINANHAYAEELDRMVRDGRIHRKEAMEHPSRHALTSAIMGKPIPLVDTGSGVLKAGERLLMASDGIQTLRDREIEELLKGEGRDLESAVKGLLRAVEEKDFFHQDNVTVILLEAADREVFLD